MKKLNKLNSESVNVLTSVDTEKKKVEECFAKLEQNMVIPEVLLQKGEEKILDNRNSSQLLNDELSHFNSKHGGLLSDSNLFELDKTPTKHSYHTFIGKTPSLKLEDDTPTPDDGLPISREVSDNIILSQASKSKNSKKSYEPGKGSFV